MSLQAYMQKSSLKGQGVETFSAVPLGIAVGCITVFVVSNNNNYYN